MNWSKRKLILLGTSLLALVGLGVAVSAVKMRSNRTDPAEPATVSASAADPAATSSVTVPEHTALHVRLNQAISTDRNKPGDHFTATVSEPVVVDNTTVVPKGAEVEGLVVDAERSGRLRGRARLELALQKVNVNGSEYPIRTTRASRVSGNHKKRNIAWIGGGGGAGAVIGAIAAGGKGALIGGPIGAGAGTAVAFATGRKNVHLPAESAMSFRLAEPVTIQTQTARS